ncbi:MAG: trypsin-like peptidase domain-containing protein [bacterium]
MFPEPQNYEQNVLGSGLVIDKKGYILTNEHVIRGAEEIIVTFKNGKKYKGTIIGQDKNRDIAVIKIKEHNLPIAKIGNSNDLMIGEWVVAIGNPFGLENTVTVGVISGTNRSLRAEKNTSEIFENLIQTDASINPGNSGGPLVNVLGEVIGINTAIYQNAQGIGFAIPIDTAKKIVEKIINYEKNYEKVKEVFLGIHIQEITPEISKILNIPQKGVLICDITKNSPAEKSGLKIKDVIIKINKKNIPNITTFEQIINNLEIGKKTLLTVIRNNKEITNIIIPQEKKDTNTNINTLLGMKVKTVSSETKKKYGFYSSQGVVVIEVTGGAWANRVGIQEGDVIIKINNVSIQNINDYAKILSKIKKKKEITMFLERGFSTLYLQTNID